MGQVSPPGGALQTEGDLGPAEPSRDPTAKLPITNTRSPELRLISTLSVKGKGQTNNNHARVNRRREAKIPLRERKGNRERPKKEERRKRSNLGVFRVGVGRRDLHSHGLFPRPGPGHLPFWREANPLGPIKGRQTTNRLFTDGLTSQEDPERPQIDLNSTGASFRRSSSSRVLDSGRKVEFSKFPREAGSSCHGYSGKWPYPDLQGQAAPSRYLEKGQAGHFGQHSREIPDFSKSSSLPKTIHLRVGERGHCDKKHPRNSRKSSHKSPFSRPKGHRQDPPYNRPFLHERVCRVPKVQDGASSQDHQGSPEPFVGGKDRHSGRLPVCIDLRLLPKVFLLLDRQRHVHVQTNALRSHNRPFHLHQTDKGHQEVPQKEGSQLKLLYRRLPHMGEHSRKGNSTSQLDSES